MDQPIKKSKVSRMEGCYTDQTKAERATHWTPRQERRVVAYSSGIDLAARHRSAEHPKPDKKAP